MTFKIGDRVRGLVSDSWHKAGDLGTILQDDSRFPYVRWDRSPDITDTCEYDCNLELVTNKKRQSVKRTFRLLKDTPDIKKGAILQEQCTDGTQPYQLIAIEDYKGSDSRDTDDIIFTDRSLVENQPQWFVEVFEAVPKYMTKEELAKYNAFIGKKVVKAKRPVGRPRKNK